MNSSTHSPTRQLPILLGGLVAAVLSAMLFRDSVFLRATPLDWSVIAVVATVIGLGLARYRGISLDAAMLGFALFAAAMTLSGLPELPPWPSVDAFGKSPWFVYGTAVVTLLAVGLAVPRREFGIAEGGLALFVIFSAFGGPFFIRASDHFAGLFILFAVATLPLGANTTRRSWRRVPFLTPLVLFVVLALVGVVVAVDRDRHLTGCARIVAAMVPLLLLGFGPIQPERGVRLVRVFAAMVVAGFVGALVVVFEAGYHFDLSKALQAQLTLFGEHPNIVAPYFAVAPPLILALLPSTRSTVGRLGIAVALLAAIGGLYLTRSRAAMGGALIGVGSFAALLASVALLRRRPGATTVIALITVATFLVVGGTFAGRGRIESELGKTSMQFRTYLWGTALDAIQERPLLGYGYQTGDPLMANADPSDLDGRSKDTHPHNLVLAIAMGNGIPASLLFVAMLTWFAIQTLRAATALREQRYRWLAVGVVGSAVGLLAANMLDQGLSLHAPFPYHLGLLIGIGSLLVLASRAESSSAEGAVDVADGASSPPRSAVPFATPVAVALALIALPPLVADRFAAAAGIAERRNQPDVALRAALNAARVNPLHLGHGLLAAKHRVATNDIPGAVEQLRRVSARHPLSAIAWDRISNLEVERRDYKSALEALHHAQELDATGPLTAEWKLREGEIYIRVGNQLKAEEAFAAGIRYDYEAVHRIPWRYSETDVREYYLKGPQRPIFLVELLGKNRQLMPTAVAENPILGRRLATTLVKTLMRYHRFNTAQKVIAEYRQITPVPWLPLNVLEGELYRLWDPDTNSIRKELLDQAGIDPANAPALTADASPVDETSPADEAAASTPPAPVEPQRFDGEQGEAGLLMVQGERLLTDGQPEQAIALLETAIDEKVYDMVAERHYVARMVDDILKGRRDLKDADHVEVAARAALYFNATPNLRVERYLWMAETYIAAGKLDDGMATLEQASRLLPRIGARKGDLLIQPFATTLAPYLADKASPETRARAERLLASVADSSPGKLLHSYTLFKLNKKQEAAQHLNQLQQADPDWFRELQDARPTGIRSSSDE